MGFRQDISSGKGKNRKRKRRNSSGSLSGDSISWENGGKPIQKSEEGIAREKFLLGIVVAVALMLGVVLLILPKLEQVEKNAVKTSQDPKSAPLIFAAPSSAEEKSEAAIGALLNFVNAPDHTSRCEYIVGRESMSDALDAYYERDLHSLPSRIINPSVSAVRMNDHEIVIVSFIDQDGRNLAAPFEWDGDAYRMHWEAFTGYGEITWQQFFEYKPQGMFKMRANLYIPEGAVKEAAASGKITVLISHPDLPKPQTLTVLRGSYVYQILLNLPPVMDIPAHIGVSWPSGDASGSPVLNRWLHRDWIAP